MKPGDHAVERHVVVIAFARQLLDALDVLGREIGPQLDDDPPVLGVDQQRVLRIGAGGQRSGQRRAPRRSARRTERAGGSWKLLWHRSGFSRSCRRTSPSDGRRPAAARSALTSPPIEAIWRTSVAVIGRTGGDAGRKTVCTSGAIAPFMPGHLHLVVEVGAAAQAADQHRRARALRGGDDEIGEGGGARTRSPPRARAARRSPAAWRAARRC